MTSCCSAKRKTLSIEETVCVIMACQNKLKRPEVCHKFGLVNCTIGAVLKNKDKILKAFEGDWAKNKIRKYEHTDVDTALLKWLKQCRSSGIPVNRSIMKKTGSFWKIL